MIESRKLSKDKVNEVVDHFKKSAQLWFEAYGTNITNFRSDTLFYQGEQFNGDELENFYQRNKEPIVHNLLTPTVRQIIGEFANIDPDIVLLAENELSKNPDMVELLSNFLRYQIFGEHVKAPLEQALLHQIVGGWGVMGVETKYSSAVEFSQDISTRRFKFPQNVFFDLLSKSKYKNDGEFQGTIEVYLKEDAERLYPSVDFSQGVGWLGVNTEWMNIERGGCVLIGEFYRREYKNKTLLQVTNGQDFTRNIFEEEFADLQEQYAEMMSQQGISALETPPLQIAQKRRTQQAEIHFYRLSDRHILEHTIFPGEKLPWVFVPGWVDYSDGKEWTHSLIEAARAPQKMYNYCLTELLSGISKARRDQMIMSVNEYKGLEELYRNPDRNIGVSLFNPDPLIGGRPSPVPPQQVPQQLFEMARQAYEDIQRALGVFAPNRGQVEDDRAGKALKITINQANLALKYLFNNLFGAMQELGECVIKIMPIIYDTERVIKVMDESKSITSATINERVGNRFNNSLEGLMYGLHVKPGVAFDVQEAESRQELLQLASANPQAFILLADLIAATASTPISNKASERLRTLLPEAILAKEEGREPKKPEPSPQELLMLAEISAKKSQTQKNLAEAEAKIIKAQTDAHEAKHSVQTKAYEAQSKAFQSKIKTSAELQKAQIEQNTEILKLLQQEAKDSRGMGILKHLQQTR